MPAVLQRVRGCCRSACRRLGRPSVHDDTRPLNGRAQEAPQTPRTLAPESSARLSTRRRQEAQEAAIFQSLSLNAEGADYFEDAAIAADAALARALAEVWAAEARAERLRRPRWLPREPGEEEPSRQSRRASSASSSSAPVPLPSATCPICMETKEAFPLGDCGHCLCVRCAVTYVRTAIGNASEEVKPQGIRCAMHCSGCADFVTPDTVRRLLEASRLAEPATASFMGPIQPEEVERMDRFVVEASVGFDEKVHCPKCSNPILIGPGSEVRCECPYCGKRWDRSEQGGQDTATDALLQGSSKSCPNCGVHVTHYHGHGCHHISPGTGCRGCGQHFCYVCRRKHGRPGAREWHKDCEHRMSFCKHNHLRGNIVMQPFPHDRRCGCPICPDCRPSKPCPQCTGSCVVCMGAVSPGGQLLEGRR